MSSLIHSVDINTRLTEPLFVEDVRITEEVVVSFHADRMARVLEYASQLSHCALEWTINDLLSDGEFVDKDRRIRAFGAKYKFRHIEVDTNYTNMIHLHFTEREPDEQMA